MMQITLTSKYNIGDTAVLWVHNRCETVIIQDVIFDKGFRYLTDTYDFYIDELELN